MLSRVTFIRFAINRCFFLLVGNFYQLDVKFKIIAENNLSRIYREKPVEADKKKHIFATFSTNDNKCQGQSLITGSNTKN